MRKRRKKENKSEEVSMIGKIIDLPFEDFKKEVEEVQKLPIGIVHNVALNLIGVYYELNARKENIIKQVAEGTLKKDDPIVKKSLEGIYAEMIKVEHKVLYLKRREKELANLERGVVDSTEQ